MMRRALLIAFIITLGLMVAAADVVQAQGRGGGGGGRGGWGGGRGAGGGWQGNPGGRNNPGRNNTPGRGGRGGGQGEDGPDGLGGWVDWIDGTVEQGAKAEATDSDEGATERPSSGGNPMAGFGARRSKDRDTDGMVIRQVEDQIEKEGKSIIVIYVYQASAEPKDARATEACKKFEETVLADDDVARLINKGVAIRVHIDDVDRDVKKLYGLRSSVPQIVILDPTGKKLWAGAAPSVDQLKKYLESAHEKVAKEFGTDEDEEDSEDGDADGDDGDDDDGDEPSSDDDGK